MCGRLGGSHPGQCDCPEHRRAQVPSFVAFYWFVCPASESLRENCLTFCTLGPVARSGRQGRKLGDPFYSQTGKGTRRQERSACWL